MTPDLSARVAALEAAVFKLGHHALHGLQQRDRPKLSVLLAKVNGYVPAAAPPPPAAAPCADEVEVGALALYRHNNELIRGIYTWDDAPEGLRDEFRSAVSAILAALSPLRQAERERARADGIEEAARVCDKRSDAHRLLAMVYCGSLVGDAHQEAERDLRGVASAIRALAPAPAAEVA